MWGPSIIGFGSYHYSMIFVYGTLLKGEENAEYLSEAELVARNVCTNGSLIDTGCGYPGLLKSGRGNGAW